MRVNFCNACFSEFDISDDAMNLHVDSQSHVNAVNCYENGNETGYIEGLYAGLLKSGSRRNKIFEILKTIGYEKDFSGISNDEAYKFFNYLIKRRNNMEKLFQKDVINKVSIDNQVDSNEKFLSNSDCSDFYVEDDFVSDEDIFDF